MVLPKNDENKASSPSQHLALCLSEFSQKNTKHTQQTLKMTDTDYTAAAEATAPVTTTDNKSLNCRLYEQKYPEVEDIVMVRVKSIAEMGASSSSSSLYRI